MGSMAKHSSVAPNLLVASSYRVVDLADSQQVADATRWWEAPTGVGGEGM
jgi:hypothetical protein